MTAAKSTFSFDYEPDFPPDDNVVIPQKANMRRGSMNETRRRVDGTRTKRHPTIEKILEMEDERRAILRRVSLFSNLIFLTTRSTPVNAVRKSKIRDI